MKNHLVLILAATALLTDGCTSTNIKIPTDLDNNIEPESELPSKPDRTSRKFLNLTHWPNALYRHEPGTTVTLTCEAFGSPAPTIRWFKNNAPVFEHDQESMEIIDTNPSSLARVYSTLLVTSTEGQDRYTCVTTSGVHSDSASTTVYNFDGSTDLSERSKLSPLEPKIVVSYKIYVDVIGSTVVLPCRVKGHPRPKIIWRDNIGVVVKRNPRMKVLHSGELVLSSLRWGDMGEFTCHAFNIFGSATQKIFLYPAKAG